MREPGRHPAGRGDPGASLLDPALDHDGPTELLYFATARADLVGRVIRPALPPGGSSSRIASPLSTEAYQIGGRGVRPELVRDVNLIATEGLQPDLTLVLDLPRTRVPAGRRGRGRRRTGWSARTTRSTGGWPSGIERRRDPGCRHLDASRAARLMCWPPPGSKCRTMRPAAFAGASR